MLCGGTPEGPTVSSVRPLFGPQAGGTLVTITGSELIDSQQPLIVFVSSRSRHFVTLTTRAARQYRTSDRYAQSFQCYAIAHPTCSLVLTERGRVADSVNFWAHSMGP